MSLHLSNELSCIGPQNAQLQPCCKSLKTDLRLRSHQSGSKKSSHPQSLATIFSQLKYFPRPRWTEYILPLWHEKAWWCWIQSRSWFHYVNGLGHASPIQPDYHLFSKFENPYCTVFLHCPVVQWVFVKWVKRFCSFPFVPPWPNICGCFEATQSSAHSHLKSHSNSPFVFFRSWWALCLTMHAHKSRNLLLSE